MRSTSRLRHLLLQGRRYDSRKKATIVCGPAPARKSSAVAGKSGAGFGRDAAPYRVREALERVRDVIVRDELRRDKEDRVCREHRSGLVSARVRVRRLQPSVYGGAAWLTHRAFLTSTSIVHGCGDPSSLTEKSMPSG